MSLFIGSLAFEGVGENAMFQDRLGIILGSLLSGVFGLFWIRWALRDPPHPLYAKRGKA
jgi:NhaA family Na+:H+ antiporter